MAKLDVKTLGHSGVIIDSNPHEPSTPDDALANAQNATHDPKAGYGGGLRKRPGLKRFNLDFAGGAILGGIPMAVAGTGGAPATGGGATTGSSDGAGDGTGAPGGTSGDGGAVDFGSIAATQFTSSQLFNGARLIAISFANNQLSNYYGHGWWLTSKKFQDDAVLITTSPSHPAYPGNTDPAKYHPMPSVILSSDGMLYYVKAHDETGSGTTSGVLGSPSPLRKLNGASDVSIGVIHTNDYYPGTGTWQQAVSGMVEGDDGMIYMTVTDKVTGGNVGRLMKMDPTSGGITEINLGNPAVTPPQYADFPSCLAYFEGKVYVGNYPNVADASASINVVSSDQSYTSQDWTTAADQRFANITCMLSAGGVLYAGTGTKTAGVAAAAQLMVRQPGAGIGATSNWLAVDIVTGFGDTLASLNFISSMVMFNGALYIAWYCPGQKSRIIKATPNPDVSGFQSVDPTAGVYASSGATGRVPYSLFVDDGVLYAIGTTGSGGANRFLWTEDGTTWTDASAHFSVVHQEYPNSIFYAMDQ